MVYRHYVEVHFRCRCGKPARAVMWDSPYGNLRDDVVRCTCGKAYLVARPYIIDAKDVIVRVESD